MPRQKKNSEDKKKNKKKEAVSVQENSDQDMLEVNKIKFPDLDEPAQKKTVNSSMFDNIPVKVTAELGSTTVSLKDVHELSEGAVIELERLAGEPLDLLVNGQLIAQGEVVAVDNNYGLRIKSIIKDNKE